MNSERISAIMTDSHKFYALYVEDGEIITYGGRAYVVDEASFNSTGKVVLRCNGDTATLILEPMEHVYIHLKDAA